MAALTTTTVRWRSGGHRGHQRVLLPGKGERALVDRLGLLLLGQPDDDHGDLGRARRLHCGADRLLGGCWGRVRDEALHAHA